MKTPKQHLSDAMTLDNRTIDGVIYVPVETALTAIENGMKDAQNHSDLRSRNLTVAILGIKEVESE